VHTLAQVAFQWDPKKALANVQKHGIDFADAVGVFEDPHGRTLDDSHPSEQRFASLGMDLLGRILVVSWTARKDDIRLISARLATRRERRQYEMEE